MALYLKRICYNLDSELNKFEFYIAFASKLGGATGLNRIVKER